MRSHESKPRNESHPATGQESEKKKKNDFMNEIEEMGLLHCRPLEL